MNAPGKQRGVALLVALLVVALCVVLIAGLLDRGELANARVRNALREAQAQSYGEGLEAYAARVLTQAALSGNEADSNNSPWAVPLPPTAVPGGRIVASMRDRNGCFNINNLLDDNGAPSTIWLPKFRRLLQALRLDDSLADVVVNWMRSGSAPDDQYYLQQPVPYRPAKRDLVHVSELRLVRGVTSDVYAHLEPEVCALPRGSVVNINTASVAVLMTLSSVVNEQVAKSVAQGGHANYGSIDDARGQLPGQLIECGGAGVPATRCYDVKSSYFVVRGDITLDSLPFTYFSLIERRYGGSNAGIRVIERSRGGDL